MWVYLIVIAIGNVRSFTSDTDPDVEKAALTPDISMTTATDKNLQHASTQVIIDEDQNVTFPFMAAVLHTNHYLLGAGAIVGDKWILVTAFQMGAFEANQLMVRVGSKTSDLDGQLLEVEKLFPHPMFKEFNNDVALLKTTKEIVFSSESQPIPVAESPPEMGAQATLFTWDEDHVVKKNKADILPVSECRPFYPDFELTESNICVVLDHTLPYQVSLYGSPLVFNGSLVGLYMGLEADTYKPSLCSKMSPLTGWIQLMMTNETETQNLFPLQ